MRRLLAAALVVACTGLVGSARAAGNDPTGTWKFPTARGEATVKLKLEGDKVTGAMIRKAGDLKVEDGIFKGGASSFRVPRRNSWRAAHGAHVPRQAHGRYHQGLGHDRAPGSSRHGRMGSEAGQGLGGNRGDTLAHLLRGKPCGKNTVLAKEGGQGSYPANRLQASGSNYPKHKIRSRRQRRAERQSRHPGQQDRADHSGVGRAIDEANAE
jgi:hypothetical protein